MPVQTQILTRRGTAASWTSTNPTLGAGEIGYETDTGRFKIGTGAAAWASLGYFNRDPLTTKGDLYTFSTTDDRLAVGANGESLVADSSTSTGLRYTAGNPIPNPVLNSAMSVWQRGTSSAVTSSSISFMLADRWNAYRGATGSTVSRQATGDTTNLPNIQYCHRFQRDSGNTSTANLNLLQNFETVNSIPFAGKQITLSFYARAGANYSATSNALLIWLRNGTGTDQNFLSGYTGVNDVISSSGTLTTTWQRFTFTGTVPTNSTELAIQIQANPTGTAGANDYFEVTGVQLDVGSVALPFRTYAGTIQGELAACQRYYRRLNAGTAYGTFKGVGVCTSTTKAELVISLDIELRTNPSFASSGNFQIVNGGASTNTTSIGSGQLNTTSPQIEANVASGLTTGFGAYLRSNNSTASYLEFSAEL